MGNVTAGTNSTESQVNHDHTGYTLRACCPGLAESGLTHHVRVVIYVATSGCGYV